ncbi:selenocysteine-specific translation elongation factor [Citroniella saccharovorans]|uniref:Selenocysteine-specific elongation factor n=1 Tax=Citroniella saccharovorans TaxID=2053367 RepID=A0AAW9MS20_9FIRM|nr:selenocysteine-specific translation elongation factor [Citroniella saccharovorans]MEB3429934.1 selenocysteine-specific translation elongation factor [Citroniella saccharovorans]
MKNIIVGTAGHIDHGKTTLIKALTGRNTDRLKEEQKRGISIDLGFTFFDLPSGTRAGIIDVPGHEKFIKNMLAGAFGIDLVILVVACDEGMMPQSKEHLHILDLLGIKKGFVALTKTSMVDPEWLELVESDVKEELKGTFLENADILKVDSVKNIGIDEVKNEIDRIIKDMEETVTSGIFRLPVDRSFSISGIGTIVTGTLISGTISVNEEVEIYPNNIITKVRSIEVHDKASEKAEKGQRVALNLQGVKKEDVERGSVIAPVDSLIPTSMLDVKVKIIDSPYTINNRTRVRLYIGSNEVFARLILLEDDTCEGGKEYLAQLRLEEEIVCKEDDRFIIRLFSPVVTIGGGRVLDANPKKKKRFNEEDLKLISLFESSSEKDKLEATIKEAKGNFITLNDLVKLRNIDEESIISLLEKLEEEGKITYASVQKDRYIIHNNYLKELSNRTIQITKDYHKKYSLRPGITKEEIKSKIFPKLPKNVSDIFLSVISYGTELETYKEFIRLSSFKESQSETQKEIENKLLSSLEEYKMQAPRFSEIFKNSNFNPQEINEVVNSLIAKKELTKFEDTVLRSKDIKIFEEKVISYIKDKGQISLSEARDITNSNRKNALLILEDLDKRKITKRDGENRVLL